MPEQWVDFAELKQRVSIADVLGHYGLIEGLRKQGSDEMVGPCPFHQGKSKEPFHVSLSKNAFRCFAPHCGKQGNILDLVVFMEGTANIREAALLVQGWFPSAGEMAQHQTIQDKAPKSTERTAAPQQDTSVHEDLPDGQTGQGNDVNPPLTFALKGLDGKHPYLTERGLKPETIGYFGLGYCSRGLMKGRVCIPVHNEKGAGELVAYAGRWPGDNGWPEGEDKYKLPGGFLKSHVVFNLNRVGELARETGLIVVEGFFSCFWLHQCGFPNVVGLMGSYLSESQRDLLVAALGPQGKIVLLLDNDEAGRSCEARCLEELCQHLFVKVARLPEECNQADNLTVVEARQLLG